MLCGGAALGNPSVTGRLACLLIHRTGNFFLLQSLYFFVCSFLLQRVCRGPEEGNSDTKITEIDLFQMVLQAPVLNYCLPRFTPSRVATKLRGIPLPAHYLPRTNKQSQAEMRGGVGKPEEPSFVVQGLWGCGRGRGQAAY